MAFASAKTPVKISKTAHATKNKGATSSNDKGDLKMISIYPNFVEAIWNPIDKNDFLNFMPRSFALLLANSPKKIGCVLKELENKDNKT